MKEKTDKERIMGLEVSSQSIDKRLGSIEQSIDSIQNILTGRKDTNWGLIFTGVIVALTLYLSAIQPLSENVERQIKIAEKLADAVLIQNDKIANNTNNITLTKSQIDNLATIVEQLRIEGTPAADRRLAILEHILKIPPHK